VKPAEEAEAKADEAKPVVPALYYTHPFTYGYHYPSVYNYGHVVSPFVHVPAVAAATKEKREAEPAAEPAADPSADPWYTYGGWGGYGLTYGAYRPYAGYYGYPYSYGYGYYGRKKREAEPAAEAEADPWVTYAGLPYHYPLVYNVKPAEEAEAKADEAKPVVPALYYNHLPYTYGYHYPSVYNYGHVYSPYVYHVPAVAAATKEKREAEPAADAEADPWYSYGYYGRPYAYSAYRPYYGYGYPYRYGAYAWGK